MTTTVAVPSLPEVLEVAGGRARLRHGAQIDLGGIAKGWLADQLVADLGDNALVNLCGDLMARGGGERGDGWPVGMGVETVLLLDIGAATSGTRRRAWGEGLHHLIDPRTGLPSATDVREASVLAQTAADAEIYAKAALLLGTADAPAYLEGHGALGWYADVSVRRPFHDFVVSIRQKGPRPVHRSLLTTVTLAFGFIRVLLVSGRAVRSAGGRWTRSEP